MAERQASFRELLARVRSGAPGAERELFEQYGAHMRRVIRRRLDRRMRSKFDSTDFVQDVWATFFARYPTGPDLESPEALMKYLLAIARNKVTDAFRQRLHSYKYDVNREHSLFGSACKLAAAVAAPGPTASQVFVADEEWDRLIADTPDEYRRVLELRREGLSYPEIARTLDISEKTVARILGRLHLDRELGPMQDKAPAPPAPPKA